MRRLVNALPEKFKQPTILFYTSELSVPDIAAALNIPAGTVKSRLFKARKLKDTNGTITAALLVIQE